MNNNSNSYSKTEAKASLANFKNEVASSLNINLHNGYNGNLTSKEAGSIGGEMVKRMIQYAEQNLSGSTYTKR
ncbi:alpha/beta-type small acid-soluble spore protein [Christensenellaceae bacterium OttesenSCG-928-M15]|nr:alpha/beta-type small acid-soluble spore protein [Christensenellaceae bacterium OttesenSCG-928-M15]